MSIRIPTARIKSPWWRRLLAWIRVPAIHCKNSGTPSSDDVPGTPCTVGTRAERSVSGLGPFVQNVAQTIVLFKADFRALRDRMSATDGEHH